MWAGYAPWYYGGYPQRESLRACCRSISLALVGSKANGRVGAKSLSGHAETGNSGECERVLLTLINVLFFRYWFRISCSTLPIQSLMHLLSHVLGVTFCAMQTSSPIPPRGSWFSRTPKANLRHTKRDEGRVCCHLDYRQTNVCWALRLWPCVC